MENWQQALALPGVFKAKLKRDQGASIAQRGSVGEDVGYLLLQVADSHTLIKHVDWILANVKFDIESDLH